MAVRTPGFKRVVATAEEVADYKAKHSGHRPAVERSEHVVCGTRIWHSGFGVASHTRSCKGRAATFVTADDIDAQRQAEYEAAVGPEVVARAEAAAVESDIVLRALRRRAARQAAEAIVDGELVEEQPPAPKLYFKASTEVVLGDYIANVGRVVNRRTEGVFETFQVARWSYSLVTGTRSKTYSDVVFHAADEVVIERDNINI
jgi:hypothetical protein